MILWRVSDEKSFAKTTRYIRANSLDEAKKIFEDENIFCHAVSFQPIDETIYAVYFTDNPHDPAYFKGTKADATKGAELYIKQWNLDASIDRIVKL